MRVEHMRLQKTVCVLLRSPCDRYNKSLTLGPNWTLKGKSGAIGMSAIDSIKNTIPRILMSLKFNESSSQFNES